MSQIVKKKHFQITLTHLPPKSFQLAHNFTLIDPNIHKIATRKYKVAPISKRLQN